MRSPDRSLLVVVPAWNEEASVAGVVRDLRDEGHDVLVVDDGSRDATAAVAEAAGAVVVRLPVNLGVGAGLRCGFRYAVANGYSEVVQVDADGQHPVSAIPSLVREAVSTGAHLVIGSRFLGTHSGMRIGVLRRRVMKLLAMSATRAAGTRLTDATSGFRLISEPLLSQFALEFPAHYLGDTYEALVSAGRAGYLVREVGVVMRDRVHGTSSASMIASIQFTLRAVTLAGSGLHFPLKPMVRRSP